MPMIRSRYPKDWKAISQRIRDRAKNRCEWCGIPNYAVGYRTFDGVFIPLILEEAAGKGELPYSEARKVADHHRRVFGNTHPKAVVIVLTVAHLNHDTTDNRDENLACLCNRCHLKYDAQLHACNGRATRDRKAGQLSIEVEA